MEKINKELLEEVAAAHKNLITKILRDRWDQFAKSMEDSIGSAFERLIFEGQSFKAAMIDMANAIAREFIKIQFIQPTAQWLAKATTGWLEKLIPLATSAVAGTGGGWGTSFGGTTPMTGIPAGMMHTGGIVGGLSNHRYVPQYLFENAPRYGWLRPGEEAIIADKGERISREGERDRAPVVVNLNVHAIDTQSGIQFIMKNQNIIAAAFGKAMRGNNPVRRMGS